MEGTIISMKMIDNWAPRNKSNIPVPTTDPPVDLHGLLSEFYFAYSPGRLAWFYYRLVELVIYSFLNREDDYFNENN
jgi:hypothetical protein